MVKDTYAKGTYIIPKRYQKNAEEGLPALQKRFGGKVYFLVDSVKKDKAKSIKDKLIKKGRKVRIFDTWKDGEVQIYSDNDDDLI